MTEGGARVRIETGAGCCGLPALGLGDEEGARRAAERTVLALTAGDPEAVAVPCASCHAMIVHYYPKLLAGSPSEDAARRLATSVIDLHARILRDYGTWGADAPGCDEKPLRVTVHESCHLGRMPAMADSVRALLAALAHLELIEMDGADACCGGRRELRAGAPGDRGGDRRKEGGGDPGDGRRRGRHELPRMRDADPRGPAPGGPRVAGRASAGTDRPRGGLRPQGNEPKRKRLTDPLDGDEIEIQAEEGDEDREQEGREGRRVEGD